MSSHRGHDELRDQIILGISQARLGICWPNETGLVRAFDNPERTFFTGLVGSSDILGILQGGFFLCVEVKTGRGKLRNSQINFKAMVDRMGGCFIEGRSVDQVLNEIIIYLKNKEHL